MRMTEKGVLKRTTFYSHSSPFINKILKTIWFYILHIFWLLSENFMIIYFVIAFIWIRRPENRVLKINTHYYIFMHSLVNDFKFILLRVVKNIIQKQRNHHRPTNNHVNIMLIAIQQKKLNMNLMHLFFFRCHLWLHRMHYIIILCHASFKELMREMI